MEAIMQFTRYDFKKWLWGLVLTGLALVICFCATSSVMAWDYGGFMSEFLMGRQGTDNSLLVIERSGVADSSLDLTMGAFITTLPATSVSMNNATLNARVDDLNGFPNATVYFEWGETSAYGNTSSSTTVSSTGDVGITISGIDSAIHYRAVIETDGITYGTDRTVTSGMYTGHNLLQLLIPLIIAAGTIIYSIRMKSLTVGLMGLAACILSYVIAGIMLASL